MSSRVLIFSSIYLGAPSRLDHFRATPYIAPSDVPIHQYHDTYHRAYLSSLSLEFLRTHPRLYHNIAAFVIHTTHKNIQRVSYPNRDMGLPVPSRALKNGRPCVESTTTQHIWTSASASTYFRLDELILDVLSAITPTTQAQPTSLLTVQSLDACAVKRDWQPGLTILNQIDLPLAGKLYAKVGIDCHPAFVGIWSAT